MPQSTEGVLLVVGALFFLIGLLGGGLEVSAVKIPPIQKIPRYVILAVGSLLMVVGLFRIVFPASTPVLPTTNTSVAVATPLVPTPAPIIPTGTQPPPTPVQQPANANPTAATPALPANPTAATPTVPAAPTPVSRPGSAATTVETAAPSATVSSIWRQGDIVAQARLVSIADAGFGLELRLTNEGASDFSAKFRMEDATAKDDTGQTYASANQAGQREDSIGPNQTRNYFFSFNGQLNPAAKNLTFQLTPLSNLSNLSVEVLLGRDTADLRLTASIANSGNTSLDVSFVITNESGNDFIAQFRGDDVSLTDDVGNTYSMTTTPRLTVDMIGPNQSRNYFFSFKGPLNPNAKKLTLHVAELSGTPDVKVEFPVSQ